MTVSVMTLSIEKTYTLLEQYLSNSQYSSSFPSINEKTPFEYIGKYIHALIPGKSFDVNVHGLHKQLAYILYLLQLSYFYVNNSSVFGVFYVKIGFDPHKSKARLTTIKALIEAQQKTFRNNLKTLLQEDCVAETALLGTLTEHYIDYLQEIVDSSISPVSDWVGSKFGKLDFTKIKKEAKKNCLEFTRMLKKYNLVNEKKYFTGKDEDDDDEFFDCMDDDEIFFDCIEDDEQCVAQENDRHLAGLSLLPRLVNAPSDISKIQFTRGP